MPLSKIEAGPPSYDYRLDARTVGAAHTMIAADPLDADVNGWLLGEVMPAVSFTR